VRVNWPVTVEAGDQRLDLETVDLSPGGAKVRLDRPLLQPGMAARLRFQPPAGLPLEVEGIVWRVDIDGPAFFFVGAEGQDVTVSTEPLSSEPPHSNDYP
jgi:hypothetical protein